MTRALPALRPPSVVVIDNPLASVQRHGLPVPVGTRIDEIAEVGLPVMVRLNGQWLLRAQWWRPLLPGDVLELHHIPQGGGGGSNPLRLIATLALLYLAPQLAPALKLAGIATGVSSAFITAAAVIAGNAAINALLPVETAGFSGLGPGASPTYSTSLAGNQARLDQPICVQYGRHQRFPDFAAEPYTEFGTPGETAADPPADDESDEQYYYALLCIGMGSYVQERVLLGNTDIDHFQDVQINWLEPGEPPTLVLANVSTALEITGQELLTGRFVGPFAASRPQRAAAAIGIDIVLNGLGVQSGGGIANASVTLRFDSRPIDDFGVPSGAWATLGTEIITAASASQVRRSVKYTLSAAARIEVRAVRTDIKVESLGTLNSPQWAGLRAYLDDTPELAANATHLEVRMRASEQLNGLTERRISVTARRKVRAWSPGGGWTAAAESRSIAWALADKWSNTEYGDSLPDDRMDLQTLYELDQVWTARQDRLDIVFDASTDSDTADQLIARAGRARVFRRNGVRSVARDQAQDLPVTAYTSRDIEPGSASIRYLCDVAKIPDAIVVEYFDNRAWDWRPITCNAPGVVTPANPEFFRLPGVTGAKHAQREGLYEAAARFYRRRFASWSTELQGLLPAFGSAVVFAPALRGWGQAGDVAFWDNSALEAGLTEQPVFSDGASHFISLLNDDGSLSDAIAVSPGSDEWSVVLASAPVQAPVTTDGTRERTRYVFGSTAEHRRIVRMLGIRPQSLDGGEGEAPRLTVQMDGVLEDERVHTVDNALLPGPGEIQDPVDSQNEGDFGGGELLIVNLTERHVRIRPFGVLTTVAFTLHNDGRASGSIGAGTTYYANEWLYQQPQEASTCARFEVRATLVVGAVPSGDALDTWLSLGTSRSWSLQDDGATGKGAYLQLEIRDETLLVQDTDVAVLDIEPDSGGGA